jgi:hypothetical protein
MVQHTLSHTVVLEVSADDIWEVSKQLDEILPALEPEYFTKSTFVEGFPGEPGSIRLVKPGPGITIYIPKYPLVSNCVIWCLLNP